jgi:hypothetical protein
MPVRKEESYHHACPTIILEKKELGGLIRKSVSELENSLLILRWRCSNIRAEGAFGRSGWSWQLGSSYSPEPRNMT